MTISAPPATPFNKKFEIVAPLHPLFLKLKNQQVDALFYFRNIQNQLMNR